MPKLIGITGPSGSGKDTLGNILYHYHGYTQMAFAVPLKKAASAAFGDAEGYFHTQEGKRSINSYWNITRRKMLQDFGETMCQQFGADFWIKRWFMDFTLLRDTDNIVITDVRKDSEADFIRGLGGVIVTISRQGAGLSGEEAKHLTERGITCKSRDVLLRNNGSLEDLKHKASCLVAYVEGHDKAMVVI